MLKLIVLLLLCTEILLVLCWSVPSRSIGVLNGDRDWTMSEKKSMLLGTGLSWGRGDQRSRGKDINKCALSGVALGRLVSVIGAPQGDHPLAGFMILGRVDTRFIKV